MQQTQNKLKYNNINNTHPLDQAAQPSGSNNNTLLDQFRPTQNKKRHNKLTNNNINKTNNHNTLDQATPFQDQTTLLLDQTVAIPNATNTKQAKTQQHKRPHTFGSNNTLSGSNSSHPQSIRHKTT